MAGPHIVIEITRIVDETGFSHANTATAMRAIVTRPFGPFTSGIRVTSRKQPLQISMQETA
jgi:hypothetical protein